MAPIGYPYTIPPEAFSMAYFIKSLLSSNTNNIAS
jgi:hypothetical protein